ncbi:Bor/Iss family lipoprotein [Saccharospirillum mangrovi]|uniref:Bor/Iss family lipoprotein n=1 Tax=Saccharospirillum mangrovi TaxID=2161747 RepID=UPI000D3B6953|nr:Bor family protein [Saccharospirillum mangrovi]
MPLRLYLLISITLITACSTVTLAPTAGVEGEPSVREHRPFYLFGWMGDNQVSIDHACPAEDVQQIQAYRSFSDGALTLLSLGLYAPLTLDTWCAHSTAEIQP